MSKGKVYLVGAGPGDPKLITVKGLELIKIADVIVYDFLVNKELLTYAKDDAELICAGKARDHHLMKQDEINRLLADKAGEVNIVIRLKSGDPFIFGRGAEEMKYLMNRAIPVEVVPGLTSAIAVPTSCGIPLTHRDYASSLAIMTGHRQKDRELKIVNADTLVFLMAVTNLDNIVQKLIDSGRSAETPCIIIEKGTYQDQKSARGTLENIVAESKQRGIQSPAVFIVGEVAGAFD